MQHVVPTLARSAALFSSEGVSCGCVEIGEFVLRVHVLEFRLDSIAEHAARQLSEGHLADLLVEHRRGCDEHAPSGYIELALVHQEQQLHHDGLGVCSVALIETHHHTADPNKLREHKHAIIDSKGNMVVHNLVNKNCSRPLSFIYEKTRNIEAEKWVAT